MINIMIDDTTNNVKAFQDIPMGGQCYVTLRGRRELVERVPFVKSGSSARNARKLTGRGGLTFVYRDAEVVEAEAAQGNNG